MPITQQVGHKGHTNVYNAMHQPGTGGRGGTIPPTTMPKTMPASNNAFSTRGGEGKDKGKEQPPLSSSLTVATEKETAAPATTAATTTTKSAEHSKTNDKVRSVVGKEDTREGKREKKNAMGSSSSDHMSTDTSSTRAKGKKEGADHQKEHHVGGSGTSQALAPQVENRRQAGRNANPLLGQKNTTPCTAVNTANDTIVANKPAEVGVGTPLLLLPTSGKRAPTPSTPQVLEAIGVENKNTTAIEQINKPFTVSVASGTVGTAAEPHSANSNSKFTSPSTLLQHVEEEETKGDRGALTTFGKTVKVLVAAAPSTSALGVNGATKGQQQQSSSLHNFYKGKSEADYLLEITSAVQKVLAPVVPLGITTTMLPQNLESALEKQVKAEYASLNGLSGIALSSSDSTAMRGESTLITDDTTTSPTKKKKKISKPNDPPQTAFITPYGRLQHHHGPSSFMADTRKTLQRQAAEVVALRRDTPGFRFEAKASAIIHEKALRPTWRTDADIPTTDVAKHKCDLVPVPEEALDYVPSGNVELAVMGRPEPMPKALQKIKQMAKDELMLINAPPEQREQLRQQLRVQRGEVDEAEAIRGTQTVLAEIRRVLREAKEKSAQQAVASSSSSIQENNAGDIGQGAGGGGVRQITSVAKGGHTHHHAKAELVRSDVSHELLYRFVRDHPKEAVTVATKAMQDVKSSRADRIRERKGQKRHVHVLFKDVFRDTSVSTFPSQSLRDTAADLVRSRAGHSVIGRGDRSHMTEASEAEISNDDDEDYTRNSGTNPNNYMYHTRKMNTTVASSFIQRARVGFRPLSSNEIELLWHLLLSVSERKNGAAPSTTTTTPTSRALAISSSSSSSRAEAGGNRYNNPPLTCENERDALDKLLQFVTSREDQSFLQPLRPNFWRHQGADVDVAGQEHEAEQRGESRCGLNDELAMIKQQNIHTSSPPASSSQCESEEYSLAMAIVGYLYGAAAHAADRFFADDSSLSGSNSNYLQVVAPTSSSSMVGTTIGGRERASVIDNESNNTCNNRTREGSTTNSAQPPLLPSFPPSPVVSIPERQTSTFAVSVPLGASQMPEHLATTHSVKKMLAFAMCGRDVVVGDPDIEDSPSSHPNRKTEGGSSLSVCAGGPLTGRNKSIGIGAFGGELSNCSHTRFLTTLKKVIEGQRAVDEALLFGVGGVDEHNDPLTRGQRAELTQLNRLTRIDFTAEKPLAAIVKQHQHQHQQGWAGGGGGDTRNLSIISSPPDERGGISSISGIYSSQQTNEANGVFSPPFMTSSRDPTLEELEIITDLIVEEEEEEMAEEGRGGNRGRDKDDKEGTASVTISRISTSASAAASSPPSRAELLRSLPKAASNNGILTGQELVDADPYWATLYRHMHEDALAKSKQDEDEEIRLNPLPGDFEPTCVICWSQYDQCSGSGKSGAYTVKSTQGGGGGGAKNGGPPRPSKLRRRTLLRSAGTDENDTAYNNSLLLLGLSSQSEDDLYQPDENKAVETDKPSDTTVKNSRGIAIAIPNVNPLAIAKQTTAAVANAGLPPSQAANTDRESTPTLAAVKEFSSKTVDQRSQARRTRRSVSLEFAEEIQRRKEEEDQKAEESERAELLLSSEKAANGLTHWRSMHHFVNVRQRKALERAMACREASSAVVNTNPQQLASLLEGARQASVQWKLARSLTPLPQRSNSNNANTTLLHPLAVSSIDFLPSGSQRPSALSIVNRSSYSLMPLAMGASLVGMKSNLNANRGVNNDGDFALDPKYASLNWTQEMTLQHKQNKKEKGDRLAQATDTRVAGGVGANKRLLLAPLRPEPNDELNGVGANNVDAPNYTTVGNISPRSTCTHTTAAGTTVSSAARHRAGSGASKGRRKEQLFSSAASDALSTNSIINRREGLNSMWDEPRKKMTLQAMRWAEARKLWCRIAGLMSLLEFPSRSSSDTTFSTKATRNSMSPPNHLSHSLTPQQALAEVIEESLLSDLLNVILEDRCVRRSTFFIWLRLAVDNEQRMKVRRQTLLLKRRSTAAFQTGGNSLQTRLSRVRAHSTFVVGRRRQTELTLPEGERGAGEGGKEEEENRQIAALSRSSSSSSLEEIVTNLGTFLTDDKSKGSILQTKAAGSKAWVGMKKIDDAGSAEGTNLNSPATPQYGRIGARASSTKGRVNELETAKGEEKEEVQNEDYLSTSSQQQPPLALSSFSSAPKLFESDVIKFLTGTRRGYRFISCVAAVFGITPKALERWCKQPAQRELGWKVPTDEGHMKATSGDATASPMSP